MTQFTLTDDEAERAGVATLGINILQPLKIGRAAEKVIAPILAKKLLADWTHDDDKVLIKAYPNMGLMNSLSIFMQRGIETRRKSVLAEIDPPKPDPILGEFATYLLGRTLGGEYMKVAADLLAKVRELDAKKGASE